MSLNSKEQAQLDTIGDSLRHSDGVNPAAVWELEADIPAYPTPAEGTTNTSNPIRQEVVYNFKNTDTGDKDNWAGQR